MKSEIDEGSVNFWTQAFDFAWQDSLVYLSVIVFSVGLILARIHPNERVVVRNMLALFLVCVLGLFVSGMMSVSEVAAHANWVHKLFVFIVGAIAIRLVGLFLFRTVLPVIKIHLPSILEDVLIFIAFFGWGLIQLSYAGLEIGELVTTSAVMTAIIAFAMRDTLGNLLGGVALQWDHSLKCGDWVRVNDVEGRVVDIRWRAIFVETRDWETVVIPNSTMMQNSFKVLGKRQDEPLQWRRWIWFNIDYNVPPSRVIAVSESAVIAAEIPNIAQLPAPNCLMMSYDTSFGRYALRYWLTDFAADAPTDSLVREHLFSALERAGMTPGLEKQHLYLTKENEKQEILRHEREVAQRIAVLRSISLFAGFGLSELNHLANELKFSPFSKGDIITQEGEVDHWLYIVMSGTAGEYLKDNEGHLERVLVLEHGDFFGEMGLLAGKPRIATVIAEDQVVCYRLDKQGFKDLINARPALIDEISQALIEDRRKIKRARRDRDIKHNDLTSHQHHLDLVNRIKQFFSITDHKKMK